MNDEKILALDVFNIFSNAVLNEIYDVDDMLERERLKTVYLIRADQLGLQTAAKKLLKKYDEKDNRLTGEYKRKNAASRYPVKLSFDSNGKPAKTIDNFSSILRYDPMFTNLKYNLQNNSIETLKDGKTVRWRDDDDASARAYIEEKYNLYHPKKLEDAVRVVAREKSYHPIKDIIEATKWDGVDRIPTMLTKWMKSPDTEYTREVSRLIFAGGIHRLYRPGCKFDDVPVLVGTSQGEGKSTFVRWLALRDDFFTEVTEIEGQKGIEAIEGGWICEIAELLALTKAKEVEAVKSYITKQTDKYRKPFERRVGEWPRQCIFIGTTNREQFLTDKTGNRRFYPVKCYSSGYELFNHKDECQADILQCWRQAKAMFDEGIIEPMAAPILRNEIRREQADAVEDDFREGIIKEYLENKSATCIIDIWENAFGYQFQKPSKKDSNEIALILQGLSGWERGKTMRFGKYGPQKGWVRLEEVFTDERDLPFND